MLKKEYRQNIISVFNAALHFHAGEYEKALKHIYEYDFIDILDKIYTKTLTAKILYESGNIDSLGYHMDSLSHFIVNSTEITDLKKISIKNFILVLKRIIRLREKYDGFKRDKLLKYVSGSIDISEKKWIMKMIVELK